MKFRTEIEAKRSHLTLSPERPLVLVGSCFADNMGAALRRGLWDAGNPLGVLFNPLSIARALSVCLIDPEPEAAFNDSLFVSGDSVKSWLCDSSGDSPDEEKALEKLQIGRAELFRMLTTGRSLCVTFGTAYGYFLADNPGYIVANCHKQPARLFTRRRIEVEEIVKCWVQLIEKLIMKYDGIEFVFTVSPVRHVRDGLHENTISKSILHLAVDEICSRFANCRYFPAYELLVDDLRDYRFYADDLAHPSRQAIEYIREKFVDTFLDAEGKSMLAEGEELNRRLEHRPIHPGSPEAIAFRDKTLSLLADFHRRHPSTFLPASATSPEPTE